MFFIFFAISCFCATKYKITGVHEVVQQQIDLFTKSEFHNYEEQTDKYSKALIQVKNNILLSGLLIGDKLNFLFNLTLVHLYIMIENYNTYRTEKSLVRLLWIKLTYSHFISAYDKLIDRAELVMDKNICDDKTRAIKDDMLSFGINEQKINDLSKYYNNFTNFLEKYNEANGIEVQKAELNIDN